MPERQSERHTDNPANNDNLLGENLEDNLEDYPDVQTELTEAILRAWQESLASTGSASTDAAKEEQEEDVAGK